MATSLQTLIPLLSFIVLLLTVASEAQPLTPPGKPKWQPPKKTYFKFDFRRQRPRDLIYQGDAHFETDPAVLRLTKTDEWGIPQPYSIGRVVYKRPVQLYKRRKQASFKTKIEFIIRPPYKGACGPADGLAFFIAPVNYPIGDPGGYLGIFNSQRKYSPIFAVEFDTYPNEWDPYSPHVGIDIGSPISRNVTEVGDALVGRKVFAWIRYDAITKLITVRGFAGSRRFEVSYVFDLRTILPPKVQVGLTASTGGCVAVHDVFKWAFYSKLVHKYY